MKRRFRIVGIVFWCVFALACTRDFKSNRETFDSGVWKTRDLRERGRMTNDLLSKNLLEGKGRAEIVELLGEPENTDKMGSMEYFTDPGAWIGGANNGPRIHYLHIEFGQTDNKVNKVFVAD